MGNRLAKTDNGTGSESYAFDNANRNRRKLVSAEATRQVGVSAAQSYASDADGSEKSAGPIFLYTLTDGDRANAWDSQNRLVSLIKAGKTCDFHYGADGLRRRMAVMRVTSVAANYSLVSPLHVGRLHHSSAACPARGAGRVRSPPVRSPVPKKHQAESLTPEERRSPLHPPLDHTPIKCKPRQAIQ